ncbi:phosphoenolpyruvate carboxylase [Serpentinimonas maccroryi]|uniref:Phosphoenolpyruvate carboxylase n=1 Tax=Serpentinimonas maccroryi TaxID=1458426 RepID=A0A060NQ76_9BURK|nr:phosphoenolpyruvate carboxylase [Serpentinimonas maccroryi]
MAASWALSWGKSISARSGSPSCDCTVTLPSATAQAWLAGTAKAATKAAALATERQRSRWGGAGGLSVAKATGPVGCIFEGQFGTDTSVIFKDIRP